MPSEHLVDPDLRDAIRNLPSGPLSLETLPIVRRMQAEDLAKAPKPEGGSVRVEKHSVTGLDGAPDIRILSYRPSEATGPLPGFLHIHGGCYVVGSPEADDAANRSLCAALGCAIFAVSYRLAPETAYPGPLDDCYAAFEWMHTHAASLDLDRTRLGVKGVSAGGGLAAALAILIRDRGGPTLAFQHLIYPMIDDRTCIEEDPHPFAGDYLWTPERNHFGWTCLLGEAPGGPSVPVYAAAARAVDLTGLPPTFIGVGAIDLFFEEDLTYARRLGRAGVPVELHVYPGAFHGFYNQPQARVAQAAARDSRDALRRSLWR